MTRKKFQYMNTRYQLKGRGITGEISTLYVNGQQIEQFKTIDEFYNNMGQQGWEIRPLGIDDKLDIFYVVMQREIFENE